MIYDIYDVINVTIGSYIIPIILYNQWRIKSYILPIGFWKDPSSVAGFWSLKKGRRDKLCSLMIYRIDDSVNCSCGGEDAKQFGFHLIWLILLCLVVPEYLSSSIPASHLEHNSPTKFQIRQTSMTPWKIWNFQVPLLHLAGWFLILPGSPSDARRKWRVTKVKEKLPRRCGASLTGCRSETPGDFTNRMNSKQGHLGSKGACQIGRVGVWLHVAFPHARTRRFRTHGCSKSRFGYMWVFQIYYKIFRLSAWEPSFRVWHLFCSQPAMNLCVTDKKFTKPGFVICGMRLTMGLASETDLTKSNLSRLERPSKLMWKKIESE